MRHDNLYRAVLFFRDWFRLDAWFHLTVNEVLNELANSIMSERLALLIGELLVLDCLLDGKGGPFAGFEVQVVGVGAVSLGVDGCEADDSLVFFGEGLQCFGEFVALLRSFGEDIGQRNTSLIHTR